MLIVNTVGPGVVRYFMDGRHPGRWSPAAGSLLDLRGAVDARDLRRVLQGRHPATGAFLPDVRPRRRRAGWDLIFGAPKSLSLLAAMQEPGGRDGVGRDGGGGIGAAHTAAVAGVVSHLEQGLRLLRQGPDGAPLPADGMLSAAFEHGDNAAGEPHLHTHVLVANLSSSHGAWGAIAGDQWFIGRRGLAALYQLELRAQLQARGWDLPWRLRPDGLADLADVPRSVVRAASTQSRVAVSAGWYAARAGATPQPWADRVAEAGLAKSVGRSAAGLRPTGLPDPLTSPELARKVSIRLTAGRSDFRRWDVVVALASSHPGGATSDQTMEWVERYCRLNRAVPSPTSGDRWTTEAARRADDELVAGLTSRPGARPGASAVVAAGRPSPSGGAEPAEVAAALTAGGGIYFLSAPAGRTHLLAQAEALDLCRQAWEREGQAVAVAAPTSEAAARWAVLAGLAPLRPGDRPDVLVVDRADRRTSTELSRLAACAAFTLVFVEGGTLPRLTNPASHGLVRVGDRLGRHVLGEHGIWTAAAPVGGEAGAGAMPAAGVPIGRPAAQALLADWLSSDGQPLLVGLGLEETRALNRAAVGLMAGRAPTLGDQDYLPGDRLVVLKGRPGLPRYGTFGTVVEVGPFVEAAPGDEGGTATRSRPGTHGWVRVAWDDGDTTETSDRRTLAGIGRGFAVTPHLAGRTDRPLMVLGPAESVGRARDRVVRDVRIGLDLGRRGISLEL